MLVPGNLKVVNQHVEVSQSAASNVSVTDACKVNTMKPHKVGNENSVNEIMNVRAK